MHLNYQVRASRARASLYTHIELHYFTEWRSPEAISWQLRPESLLRMAYPTTTTNYNVTANTSSGISTNDSTYTYPVPYVVLLSVVLVTEMIAGVLSNTAVLFSYHVNKKFIRSVSDVFIINMNVVDIIICVVSIPATLIAVISYPGIPLFCFFHEATVSFAGVASAVNVVVISIDRYDKISHPLVRRFNMRNVRWILPITWFLSLLGFFSPFIGLNHEKFSNVQSRFEKEHNLCFYWFFESRDNHLYELYYIPIFFIATIVMTRAYYGIIRITRVKTIHSALVKATVNVKVDDSNKKVIVAANNLKDPEKRVSRTTTIIILTFITCWGPHALISIVILAGGYASRADIVVEMLERWLVALGYTTTLMHPILYVFMRRNFRRAFLNSWIAQCLARLGMGRVNTPTQSHDQAAKADRRQSDRKLSRPNNRIEDRDANIPQTSTVKTRAHDDEPVQITPSQSKGDDTMLLDSGKVDNKQPIMNPCNDDFVTLPAPINEFDGPVFIFKEDFKLNINNSILTGTGDINLPSVD